MSRFIPLKEGHFITEALSLTFQNQKKKNTF